MMEFINFKITGDYIELIRLLKVSNLCSSGGEAKNILEQGLVRCNGQVELRKRLKVRKGDVIEFDKRKIIVE